MTNRKKQIESFWTWFSHNAASLAADIRGPSLAQALDARIRELDSAVSWEVGPGAFEPWQLVISPNLDREVLPRAVEIISHAPVIQGWEFYAGRRPKDWSYKFSMERSDGRSSLKIDASGWKFVLLPYPDGEREVLLQSDLLPDMDDDERWQASAIALESIVGEAVLLEKISGFHLVRQVEPRFVASLKPIKELRETVLAT